MSFPQFRKIPGIRLGEGIDSVRLDLFFDLQCPYSKKAWDVIGHSISNNWSTQLDIYFQPICLSHHRQSWDLTRTLFAIQYFDEARVIDYINAVYSDHGQFYNANWTLKGQDVFLSFLSSFSKDMVGVSEDALLKKMAEDQTHTDSKRSIHYAAVKQVWSTPTFFVNNVPLSDLTSSSTVNDWNKIISSLG